MMKKILLIIISILVLSCSSPSDPNNDNSSGNSGTGYIANGIPTMYDGTWQFYNSDSSGNTHVNVTISGGSITGLVISNDASGNKQNFDKSKIYSKEKEFDNIYYGGYNGYIVSDGDWVGEIQLPNGSSTGIGYVSIKNSSTGDIIEGILDNNSGIKRGEDTALVKDIRGTWTSDTKQLVIDAQFITYSDNGQQVFKIPFMFFTSNSTYGFTGYEIIGLLYDGVTINTDVVTKGNILFQYTENNHHLTIERGSDGVPTKAEYIINSETILPATEFIKSTK